VVIRVGEGIAVGLSIVAVGFSLLGLLRPPSATLVKDVKATVRRLEAEWNDTYERLSSASGRLAKQRGLLEKAQNAPVLESVPPVPPGRPVSRNDLLREWRLKNAAKQNSPSTSESR